MAGNQAAAQKATEQKASPERAKENITDWKVKDTNARGKARTHEPVPGVQYHLSSEEFTPMPEHHARKFLCDKAFVVVDENGDQVPAMAEEQKLGGGAQIPTLKAEQCIANYEELTMNALLARAAMRAGGERFSSKSARSQVIEFLVGAEMRIRSRRDTSKIADAETEEMSAEEADDILEGA